MRHAIRIRDRNADTQMISASALSMHDLHVVVPLSQSHRIDLAVVRYFVIRVGSLGVSEVISKVGVSCDLDDLRKSCLIRQRLCLIYHGWR